MRIAILRANRIGDLVFALPALDALRARYPTAEIVLLGRPWHAELLGSRPSPVDRVEVLPDGVLDGGRRDPRRREVLERLRSERFDLAVQMHGGGRNSNPFVRELGARLTAGMRTADAEPLDRWIPYVYHQHEIVRYLDVVALVGARPLGIEPRLPLTAEDVDASAGALPPDGRPLALLHPGATDPRRRWPVAGFARVAAALRERGMRVVATGTGDERDVLEALGDVRAPADVVIGTSLSALMGLLARSSVVVANDSGPLHLAGAVGTPTVGIYWCGNLVNGGPLSVERQRHVTSWRTHCPACDADNTVARCEHDVSFVADASVDEVMAAVDDLASRHPPTADEVDEVDAIMTRAAGRDRGRSARPPRDPAASSAPLGGTRPTA